VDAGVQTRMSRDPLQQTDEQALLVGAQGGDELAIVRAGHALGLLHQALRRGAEIQGVGAPVARVPPPFDQPARFELVDQAHHHVAMHTQAIGQLLLGLALGAGQLQQEPEVPGLQPQRPQLMGKALGGVAAELGEQEAGSRLERGERRLGRGLPHVHKMLTN